MQSVQKDELSANRRLQTIQDKPVRGKGGA